MGFTSNQIITLHGKMKQRKQLKYYRIVRQTGDFSIWPLMR